MDIENIPTEKNKKEKYLELFHGDPDAIVILSGDIVKTNEKIRDFGRETFGDVADVSGNFPDWRQSAFSDLDPHGGISGGAFRVQAAAKAARIFPQSRIITTTRDRDADAGLGRPVHADVMAEEIKRRGVEGSRIILEKKSVNTKTEIREMLILAAKNNWKRVAVVTSNYHIPRTESMWEAIKNYRENDLLEIKKDTELVEALNKLGNIEVIIISDEEILAGIEGSAWKTVFKKMKQTLGYEKRMEMETQGVKDLKDGTYGRKH